MRRQIRSARLSCASLLAAALLTMIPASDVVAASTIRIIVYMGGGCASGLSGAANKPVAIEWRDASGQLKAQTNATTDQYGGWSLCPAGEIYVAAGDTIKVRVGAALRTFTVPNLSLVVDRIHDVLRGTGPAGARLDLEWAVGDTALDRTVHVRSDGTWSFDPEATAADVVAWLAWRPANGDSVYIEETRAPQLTVDLNGRFTGMAGHRQQLTVTVTDSTGATRGTGSATAGYDGRFVGLVVDAQSHRLHLRPGDRVISTDVAPNADFIMPRITASADIARDIVSGRCYPTATFAFVASATVWRSPGHQRGSAHGDSTDSQGHFRIDTSTGDELGITSPANIKNGDRIDVDCRMVSGDAGRFTFTAR